MQNGADRLSEYGGIESSDDGWPLILVILSPCLSPELSPVLPATTGRIVGKQEVAVICLTLGPVARLLGR